MNELKTLTIKSVTSTDKKKDGTPLTGKYGPYWMVRMDTMEEGWVSMFAKGPSELKAGDKIEGTLEVTTSDVNGKTYTNKNFKFPKQDDVVMNRLMKLEGRVTTIDLSVERRVNELFAELKADLVLQLTGKFQTDKDYKKSQAPHPLIANSDPFEGISPSDEPSF